MSHRAYLAGPEGLSATIGGAIVSECIHNSVGEKVLKVEEGAPLRRTHTPMMAQLDKLNPPDVLQMSVADVGKNIGSGNLSQFSAKSNDIHLVAWPESRGLLFMLFTRPASPWSLAQVELLPTDTVDQLLEVSV